MLTKSNYHEWSLLMKSYRADSRGRRYTSAVSATMIRRALEALCTAVPTKLGASLANKATAKLEWESIAMACFGGDRGCQEMLQRLQVEWEGLTF